MGRIWDKLTTVKTELRFDEGAWKKIMPFGKLKSILENVDWENTDWKSVFSIKKGRYNEYNINEELWKKLVKLADVGFDKTKIYKALEKLNNLYGMLGKKLIDSKVCVN